MKTKHVFLYSCLLSFLAALLVFSCKKEIEIPDPPIENGLGIYESIEGKGIELDTSSGFYLKRDNPNLYRYLQLKIQEFESIGRDSTGFGVFDLEQTILVINDDSIYTHVYTVPVLGNFGNSFYNLIIEEDDFGNFNEPYLFKYTLSFDFLNDYVAGVKDFSQFEGVIQKFTFIDGQRNLIPIDCWTIVFGDGLTPQDVFTIISNSGNPNSNLNWEDWGLENGLEGIIFPVVINGGLATSACFECHPCTCQNHDCGNEKCVCGTSPGTSRWYWSFDPSCSNFLFAPSGNDGSRDWTIDECLRLMIECGIFVPLEFWPDDMISPPPPPEEITCMDHVLTFMENYGVPMCVVTKSGTSNLRDACCDDPDPVACAAQTFFGDNPLAAVLFEELQPVMDFEEDELCWLWEEDNQFLINEINDFITTHSGDPDAILYANKIVEDKDIWESTEIIDLNLFSSYDEIISYLESETISILEINNGIDVLESYLPSVPQTPVGIPFGGSDINPLGGPDLEFGTDGDLSILNTLNQSIANFSTQKLEALMKYLFLVGTISSANGKAISDNYIQEFHENDAVFNYYNPMLSTMVMNSTQMKNWLKLYGKELNNALMNNGGDISTITSIEIPRTALNETHSLTLLINDTQEINVFRLDSYNYDSQTGEWDCRFMVNVLDNFGLDDDDVIDFQNHIPGGPGFVGWWSLQHRNAWAPFVTDIWFVVHLSGQI